MTRPKIPDHGTQSRYKGARNGAWPGCRCTKCKSAHNKACHQRTLAHLAGQPPLYPREPLVQHIETLHSAGMSYGLIARRANVSTSTVRYLVRGLTKSCQRDKALRILAVQPRDFDETAERPTLGSRRRVQALYAIGHNPEAISKVSGLSVSTISHLANGRYQQIDGASAASVRAAYQKLAWVPGMSRKAKARARQMGWLGPLAWDGDMDDPATQPEVADPYRPQLANGRDSMRRAEIKHLLDLGESVHSIARQMGANEKYIRDLISQGLVDPDYAQAA